MDERHWWFASKLQETFHFGGYDNPTLLEDFLSQPDVVDLINRFLGPGEPNKLFFYCDELTAGGARAPSTSRQLCVVSQLGKDIVYLGKVCLYMLRINTGGEVDLAQMEKEIFCGELKHSVLSSFAALLTEAYGPLLHSQKDWGSCPNDTVTNFLQNVSKFSAAVMDLATFSQIHQPPLQRPSVALRNEIIQSQGKGLLSGDADVLTSCESLVNDWIGTIDSLLMDTTDERLEDPQGLPLSELSKWQRRQTLLSAVVEQLKAKECKIVIATIITGKSKLLRRWKNTDLQITDAFNNARDHVRYLQALAPHLEALQSSPSIQSVISSILPAFTLAVKQLDGLSRAYARTGYLGILFVKLSNVMKQICVRSLEVYLTTQGATLWQDMLGAIRSRAHGSAKEHTLVARLNACLDLGSSYCNHLQHLKEQLLSQQLSSPNTALKLGKKGSTPTTATTSTWHSGEAARLDSCSSAFLSASQSWGISLQQMEGTASSLGSLCTRVEQVLGIVDTLSEFRVLERHIGGLPSVAGPFAVVGGARSLSSVARGRTLDYSLELQTRVDASGNTAAIVSGEAGQAVGTETSPEVMALGCSTETCSCSVVELVFMAMNKMEQVLETALGGMVADILACIDKDIFFNGYKEYIHGVHQLELNIISYLKAVFSATMPSCRALEIIARFAPVASRPALQQIIQNCLRVAFVKYASELEEIQTTFTAQKANPPRSRNAPLIAGAIEWSRELLRRVEEPMTVFRENGALMKSMDSLHVCRLHNKLATNLLKYENLLLAKWRSSLEEAKGALTHTLLTREGEGCVVRVNCCERLLAMIAECKLLDRIGVSLPAASKELLQQEVHVKLYRQNLEHILREFYSIVGSIDPAIKPLFDVHVEAAMRCLMPGWSTLTWTTLNIDVFQYQVQTTIASLRTLVDRTHHILETSVNRTLQRIVDTSLFDSSLASAHPWVPHKFTDAMKQAVLATAALLCQEVDSVRSGVMEVISLTCQSPCDRTSHVEHNGVQSELPDPAAEPSPQGEAVLGHFCKRVFDVLSDVVIKSHDQLLGGLGYMQSTTEGHGPSKQVLKQDDQHGKNPQVLPMQLSVDVKFSIPYIHIDPDLAVIHVHAAELSSTILSILHDVRWWVGPGAGKTLYDVFEANGAIVGMQEDIQKTIEVLETRLDECLNSLRLYDFLWEQDLHSTCEHVLEGASQDSCYEQMERYLDIENKIQEIPAVLSVGPLQLSTIPMKSTLKALAVAWKMEFAAFIHKQAKASLTAVVEQRESMCQQLSAPVGGLQQLQMTLTLLGQIDDMQNVVDGLYLPVEKLYQSLKVYLPHLPRAEVQQVDGLRAGWKQLSKLAEDARCRLLSEQRLVYERELDKHVQAFTMETIQFRNSFDTEGPLVSGLTPMEAVGRLGSFLDQCAEMTAKQELICSVQKLLSMPPTVFIELERTKQDLSFLSSLYKNYQQYIDFDLRFRQELWAEVDLDAAFAEVNGFWVAFQSLPQEQQEWDASKKLRSELQQYREVLPLLKNLHSKEIRSRHWIQVMSVANCTFQLEGTIFKMSHLLDGNLLQHSVAIEQIIKNAKCELELETQFYGIEEEWSEQVLQFESYKDYGPILLAGGYTHSLLEELDHAQTQLAMMLMSPHIQPLREDTAQWAAKLASIGEVLLQWLCVQELWHNLEAVFDSRGLGHEFGEEAVRFASADKIWKSLMKTSIETKNVIQCCLGDDIPKATVLAQVAHELEECKKSLSTYLHSKRKAFPRFYFVPDSVLLSILSQTTSLQSLQPHLRLLFGPVHSFATNISGDSPVITGLHSVEGELLQLDTPVALNKAVEVWVVELLDRQRSTIRSLLSSSVNLSPTAFSLEDVALNSITQVACTALYMYWTRDCEQALAQCRYDRRAIPNTRAKFQSAVVGKLVTFLTKNYWKQSSGPFSSLLRMKLEALALLSLWLRDILDDMCSRKLRDLADFEWQRFLRFYAPMTTDGFQLVLRCLDCELTYQCDFLGAQPPPIFTPRSDIGIISFTQAMKAQLGSSFVGPESSGKVELVKGIGLLCGRHVVVVQCSSLTDKKAISNMLEGLAQDGSWACFAKLQTLSAITLAVFSQMVCTITGALRERSGTCLLLNGREISVHPKLSIFLAYNPTSGWLLPPAISAEFRTFTVTVPDTEMVFSAHCTAMGFKSARILANKLVTLHNMVKEQLSLNNTAASFSARTLFHVLQVASKKLLNTKVRGGGGGGGGEGGNKVRHTPEIGGVFSSENPVNQNQTAMGKSPRHDNKGRSVVNNLTPVIGQPLPPPVLRDHAMVAQCILSLLGPRLTERELPVFVSMVREVFVGSSSTEAGSLQLQSTAGDAGLLLSPQHNCSGPTGMDFVGCEMSIPDLLREEASKAGLVASECWMAKVEQLYTVAQYRHAVIIAGQPAVGKSAAVRTVAAAFNTRSSGAWDIRLTKVYPGAFEDPGVFCGCVSQSGEWREGMLTNIIKRAQKTTQTFTWVCMDGPLLPSWLNCITGLLGAAKGIMLANGEQLFIDHASMKLLFETGTLTEETPASIANCGIVCFDAAVLGWKPVASAWLAKRSEQEVQCLEKFLNTIMDPVSDFVLNKSSQRPVPSEVGLFETCLSYLNSLLKTYTETAEVFSETHVERLFLFSVIWSYGGVLSNEKDQLKFSALLKSLTNSIPDDDPKCSVFDYYVDESGEWDVWQNRMVEGHNTHIDLIGNVFVDTADTVRCEVLVELALMAKRSVIFSGPHAAGKTTLCSNYLDSRALNFGKTEMVKRIVLNGHSSSSTLHQFMQVNFHHRQGYIYGPKHGKLMNLFIDDLHLPLRGYDKEKCGFHEYLRQLMDNRGMFNLAKPNEWCAIEDLVVFATVANDQAPCRGLDPRLQRHFVVINVPALKGQCLATLVTTWTEGVVSQLPTSFPPSLAKDLLSASLEVYGAVREALKASTMSGRCHYLFSLGQLASVYQGLVQWPAVSSMEEMGFLWSHEMKRSFVDGICRDADSQWLQGFIDSVSKRVFLSSGGVSVAPLALSTIPKTVQKAQDGSPNLHTSIANVTLHPVSQWTDLLPFLGHHLARYREEHGPLPLVLSTEVIKHIAKLHRAISFPRGNCILVGSLGQPLVSMAKFSLYLVGHTLHTLDRSKECAFKDSLRSLFRQAGLEGKKIGVILEERDLSNGWMVDTLNSLLACGELPMLFSNDEMDGLLEALVPSIKRDFPSEEVDPLHYFTARINSNLKVILCLTPDSTLFEHQAHDFPGMLRFTHLIRMCDWTNQFLHNSAKEFFSSSELSTLVSEDTRVHLVECVVSMHRLMMQETGQLVRTGIHPTGLDPEIQTTPSGPGAPFITYTSAIPDAMPSGTECLIEKVAQLSKEVDGVVNRLAVPYVGPRTFLRFIECFCEFFKRRKAEIQATENALSKALQTLHSIQQGVEEMKAKLGELSQKLEASSKLSATLLSELTAKACQVEQSKALLGHCSAVLSAMQMVKEHDRQVADGEDKGEELLALFGDGKGPRTTRLEVLIQRVKESLLRAEEEEQIAKKAVMETKQQAIQWQNKIDRNTIDQIKSLNSPPALVGVIMDLIITLLHQHGAGIELFTSQAKSVASSIGQTPSSIRWTSGGTPSAQNAKMESKQWLSIQLAIGDSQNFLDLINSLKWEEGLSPDAVNLIESRLATSKVAEETPSSGANSQTGGAHPELITERMAKHAAECVSVLCSFAVAIVIYTKSFKPFKVITEKIRRLKQELSNLEASMLASSQLPERKSSPPNLGEVVEEVEVSEEEVLQLQQQLQEMKKGFDKVVVDRHTLSQSYQTIADKLRSSNHLLESLKPCQEAWLKKLLSLPSQSLLVDCVLASAVTVYCGPMSTNARHKVFASLKSVCSSLIVDGHSEQISLLSLSQLPNFILGETLVHHLNSAESLPQDLSTQISASLAIHPYVPAWPLIVDKLGLAVQWLRAREGATVFAKYKGPDILDCLWKCMTEGTPLVVSEVETADLPAHKLWMDVLHYREQLRGAQGPLKITVGEKKIECSPQFQLFLTTADAVTAVPAEVASLTNLIVFRPEREGLEGLLLDQALKLHNAKTFEERQQLKKVVHTQALKLVSVEEDMLRLLAGKDWEDQRTAKSLLQLNKAHEDAQESMSQALVAGQTNDHHLTNLHTMANQASVIVEVVLAMGALRSVYWTSFSYVLYVFLTFVEQAGTRVQGEETVQKMIHSIHTHFLRGYLEKDRFVFSLLLALEIEASRGQATKEEREFLVSPTPGRQFAVKGVAQEGGGGAGGGSFISFGRKPFDWMTDAQWQMLLMMASNFDWIQEILERISKDSKEAFWRSVGESVAPETITISEGIGYKLFPLQQLLILKAMRPERATQCIMAFISSVLDPKANKLAYDTPVDFGRLTKGFRPGHVCLLVYREDPNLLLTRLKQMASRSQRTLVTFTFHGTGVEELTSMEKCMEQAQSQGCWLLLHNIHTSPPLLAQLVTMMEHHPDRGGDWRLWLSSHADHTLPTALLHRVTKVSTDSPKSLRATMLHNISTAATVAFNVSSRPEYLPLLHNICMLHTLLRLRRDVYPHAWTKDYVWTQTDLVDALSYVAQEFRASEQAAPGLTGLSGVRPVSWTGIRFMISEVFYGAAITSGVDILLLSSLVDYWIHPGGPRREHGHYYIPALFFTPNSRLLPLLQAIEGATPPLVLTADLFGFHYTPIIKLGWMDYLLSHMSKLCSVLDQHMAQPTATPTLRSPSVIQSYRRLTISSTSTSTSVMGAHLSRLSQPHNLLLDKMAAPLPATAQIMELNLSAVPKAVLHSLGNDSSLLRELPLLRSVDKLMEVIPTGWKKNVVLERLKKHGLESPFALFIHEESDKMTQCLQAIHTSLQDLQNVISPNCFGDVLSEHPHLVDLALSILTLSVPKYWLEQVGPSAPPGDWPLKDWVRDLIQRFAHIDRVLTGGLAKTPTYWLGGFFNPQAFLNVVEQSVIKSCCSLCGPAEQIMFVADLTARDKDHIRDPPAEGELFVHGVYLWGIGFEKTATLELRDVPPKPPIPTPLPLLHLTITAKPELPVSQQTEAKGPYLYQCPVYVSNRSHSSPLFTLNISSNEVGQSKWVMRNLACTLRPY